MVIEARVIDSNSDPQKRWDIDAIAALDSREFDRFEDRIVVEDSLTRNLVSFQGNKTRSFYRWFKYKEAFSAQLVEYLLDQYQISDGCILDPFAGMGTTLFAATSCGLDADGIELLPVGCEIIRARQRLECGFSEEDFERLSHWASAQPWKDATDDRPLNVLRITDRAYSQETHSAIEQYLCALENESENTQAALKLALLCVLESVSFTRKDGQYLRWDYRAGRRQGSRPFDKGHILPFDSAISSKLAEIAQDLSGSSEQGVLFAELTSSGRLQLLEGSCLDIMPSLPTETYRAIITSPPYCNRYDYTRTYALELALLGVEEKELSALRQQMLTCTVENREKDILAANPAWSDPIAAADGNSLLQAILSYLNQQKAEGRLNNNGIPRMVRGYFYEMACIIAECSRVLVPGGRLIMVNDNVRYAGASVSVDIILSGIAERLGMKVDNILVLPNGKGNSSQQMGLHGRDEIRKCVYVWSKLPGSL